LSSSHVLAGKCAIVFGASRGIGEQIARSLAAAGAQVMLASRDVEALEKITQEINAGGESAAWIRADMLDGASIEAAVAATVDRFGKLNVAVNNAGTLEKHAPIAEITDEMFDRVVATNLRGTFIAMKHEVRAILRGGGGSIVNISSATGTLGVPFTAPYTASKHGVNGLTKTAATELAKQGVRVNAIAPGGVMTELLRDGPASDPAKLEKAMATIPIGRLGTTQEIANAAVWLASDLSSYVTGAIIPVDGALTVP
jgi:NAD(P)-dependent dehydrogenase (short-subunit alcohol dehydrogenase family)